MTCHECTEPYEEFHNNYDSMCESHGVARLDQLKDVYGSEIMTVRAKKYIFQNEAELCAQLERLTQAPTGYIYVNPDYRQHRKYKKINFHAQSVWTNRTNELGLAREPWKWDHWNGSSDFWKSRLKYLARYGFCADASLEMTDENCVLRLFSKVGHRVLTHGFEVSKSRGWEIVDFYKQRQEELDATTGVEIRLDQTLEMNLDDLNISEGTGAIDWS